MHKALNEVLASLPDDTKVYPGHEYTKGNVKFAKTVLSNDAIKKLDEYSQANKQTQGKFTIGDEKVRFFLANFHFLPFLAFEDLNLTKYARNTMSSCALPTRSCRKSQAKLIPLMSWAHCGK